MITHQILQDTALGLKEITGRDIIILEHDGTVAAQTQTQTIDTRAKEARVPGYSCRVVLDNNAPILTVGIEGEDEEAAFIAKMAAFQIEGLVIAYKERYDKDIFFRNLLLNKVSDADISSRAKKLRIENKARRAVFLIKVSAGDDINAADILRGIFPLKTKDFICALDERSAVLVKELREADKDADIEKTAEIICDTLSAEIMSKVYVSIGPPVTSLKDVRASYNEATRALAVAGVFEPEKYVVNCGKLGIGRLAYNLPEGVCRAFLTEVLGKLTIDSFDDETIDTINKFFDNDLNISETSRQLYIHRNTLVYRLDKLQRVTGLDLRKFDDAILLKMAIMVSRFLDFTEGL